MQQELASRALVRSAWLLAGLGYLPFLAGLLALAGATPDLLGEREAFPLTVLYGSIILTFLGGIRWGVAVAHPASALPGTLAASILPSLAGFALTGWAAVATSAAPLGILAILFMMLGVWDHTAAGRGILPGWFARLRRVLTVAVSLTLALSYAFAFDRFFIH